MYIIVVLEWIIMLPRPTFAFTDVIMDMLGNFKMRQIITENYQMSSEPPLVRRAIKQARYTHL